MAAGDLAGSRSDGPRRSIGGMPRISILMACAPSDAALAERAVASVLSQDLTDWELLICEDGPTTKTAGIANLDERIVWSNTHIAAGPAVTRNLASTLASSPILRNLDADDQVADPGVLRATVDVFDSRPDVAYVVGPMIDLLEDGTQRSFPDVLEPGDIQPGVLYDGWERQHHFGLVHPTSMAIRTSIFHRYGGYPGLPSSEDTALLLPVSMLHTGYFMSRPVTLHAKRSGSITSLSWHLEEEAAVSRIEFIRRVCDAQQR